MSSSSRRPWRATGRRSIPVDVWCGPFRINQIKVRSVVSRRTWATRSQGESGATDLGHPVMAR